MFVRRMKRKVSRFTEGIKGDVVHVVGFTVGMVEGVIEARDSKKAKKILAEQERREKEARKDKMIEDALAEIARRRDAKKK